MTSETFEDFKTSVEASDWHTALSSIDRGQPSSLPMRVFTSAIPGNTHEDGYVKHITSLTAEVREGEESAEREGWLTHEDVFERLNKRLLKTA